MTNSIISFKFLLIEVTFKLGSPELNIKSKREYNKSFISFSSIKVN